MVMYQPEHDTDPKTLLNGETIDLKDGDAEIQAAIDNLFAHRNIAPFIAIRLIQRMVKSNPTMGYIRRVARKFKNNGQGVRGDMKAVIKQVLLDPEAFRGVIVRIRPADGGLYRSVIVRARGTDYSKLREPVIRYTSYLRANRAVSDYANGQMMVLEQSYHWTQEPYRQPSVFSFFLPNYQPPGELIGYPGNPRLATTGVVAPEFQQKTAVSTNRLMNLYAWQTASRYAEFTIGNDVNYRLECRLNFDLSEEDEMNQTREGLEALIDRLDLLHCCGTMPDDYKRKMADTITDQTAWMPNNPDYSLLYGNFRTDGAILTTVLSPFAAVEE